MVQFIRLPRPQTLEEAWALLAAQAQEIATLGAAVGHLQAENATLRATVATLEAQVQELTVRLGQNSSNSSQPPSSDPPSRPPRPVRPPTGRPSGGQPGHPGHGRRLRPPDEVNRVVVGTPVACGQCGTLLLGADAHPERRQVTELPVVRPEVVEYQRHTLTCLACGHATTGDWPAGLPAGAFGPRVAATVGYLTGRLGVSQRDAVDALDALFGTAVSVGSIAALEQTVSAALAEPVAAAQAYVQRQPVANVDETSWREGGQKGWLWIGVTEFVTVFLVLATRGAAGAKQLLGAAYAGIVGSDRWSAYTWLTPERRPASGGLGASDSGLRGLRGLGRRVGGGRAGVAGAGRGAVPALVSRPRWDAEPPRVPTGGRADPAGGRSPLAGRDDPRPAQDARHLPEAPGTGSGPVDLRPRGRGRADTQRRRTAVAARRALAAAQLRDAEPCREPVRRARPDRGDDAAAAAPRRPGLPDRRLRGGELRHHATLAAAYW